MAPRQRRVPLAPAELRSYTEQVITVAWPAQARGELPDEGTRLLTVLQRELYAFEPATPGQEILRRPCAPG